MVGLRKSTRPYSTFFLTEKLCEDHDNEWGVFTEGSYPSYYIAGVQQTSYLRAYTVLFSPKTLR